MSEYAWVLGVFAVAGAWWTPVAALHYYRLWTRRRRAAWRRLAIAEARGREHDRQHRPRGRFASHWPPPGARHHPLVEVREVSMHEHIASLETAAVNLARAVERGLDAIILADAARRMAAQARHVRGLMEDLRVERVEE